MIKAFDAVMPIIDKNAYIAESAVIIGDVVICEGASVWDGAVLRGDEGRIFIGKNSNVQENSTLHCDENYTVEIGENVTIGHNCIIHGCKIEDNCVIGMGAIVLNGAVVQSNTIIGAGALVSGGKTVPKGSIAMGNPFIVKRESSQKDIDYIKNNADYYVKLSKKYI